MAPARRAAAEAVDRHLDSVLTYADRVTGVTADAVGVVQEVFVDTISEARAQGEPSAETARRLLANARAASLDAVRRRRREGPPAQAPERAPTDDDLEASLRAANLGLPVAQREVLVLRDTESMAYDAVAELMSLSPLSAARLSWRACGRLRSLRGEPGDVKLDSLACDRALSLMTLAEDGPLPDVASRWLEHHLAGCERCPASARAIADTRATYRRWRRLRAAYYLREQLVDGVEQAFAADYAHASVLTRARDRSRRSRRSAPIPAAGALVLVAAATGAMTHFMPLRSGDGTGGDAGEAPPLPFASLAPLRPGAPGGDERQGAMRGDERRGAPGGDIRPARRRTVRPRPARSQVTVRTANVAPAGTPADPPRHLWRRPVPGPPDDPPEPSRHLVITRPPSAISERPAAVRKPPKVSPPCPKRHGDPPDGPRPHKPPPPVKRVKPPKHPAPERHAPPRPHRPVESRKHGPIPPGHHRHTEDNEPHGKRGK